MTKQNSENKTGFQVLAQNSPQVRSVPFLEDLFKNFSRSAEKEVKRLISGERIELLYQGSSISNLSDVTLESGQKDIWACFSAGDSQDSIFLLLDHYVLQRLVKHMLGAGEDLKKTEEELSLTAIENYLAKKIFASFERSLSESHMSFSQQDFKLNYISFEALNNAFSTKKPVFSGRFQMKVDHQESAFLLLIPFSTVQFLDVLSRKREESQERSEDYFWKSHVKSLVPESLSTLSVVLGERKITLRSLLQWKSGKTFIVGVSPDALLSVECEEKKIALAKMGVQKNHLAFSVQHNFFQEEHKNDYN